VQQLRDILHGSRLSDFKKMSVLGAGSFGAVYLVRHLGVQKVFAVKQLAKSHVVRTGQLEHLVAERDVLAKMDSSWFPRLYGTFHDNLNAYLILEFVAGGEFYNILREKGRFSDDHTKFYAACVVKGLGYLHSIGFVYRDLKPENLLLDHQGYLKITDMGFAKLLQPGERTYTLCGTPEYLAPEIISSKGHNKSVDWWCLGILIYEMLTGGPPFEDENQMELYKKIVKGTFTFPSYVSANAKDLISKLLSADLSKRLGNLAGGTQDIINHPFPGPSSRRASSKPRFQLPSRVKKMQALLRVTFLTKWFPNSVLLIARASSPLQSRPNFLRILKSAASLCKPAPCVDNIFTHDHH
jgi:serine/threonine protein kinase